MAITLPILKTMKRVQPSALLYELEAMRLHAENRHNQTTQLGRQDLAEYYAGRNDALIDAMQKIREMEADGC